MNLTKNTGGFMNWKDKRILITGCSGVIGRHLVKFLIEKGAIIRGIDIVSFPYKLNTKSFELIQKDLLYLNPLDILNFGPEIIFHLAATFERAVERIEFWKNNYFNNLLINHKVTDSFTYCDTISKFIFASSYLVYDPGLYTLKTKDNLPVSLKESSPKKPRNLTGAAKFYAEQEIEFFYNNLNRKFQFIHGRIFRVYGEGSKDVISRWVRSIIKGEAFELYSKENSFDYINSCEVALALMKLAESEYSGSVNIGMGESISIQRIIKILSNLEHNIEVKDKGKLIEFEKSKADITLLKEITGWSPKIDIEAGIQNIYEYEKAK